MMRNAHVAIDLGASSGRAMLGIFDGESNRLDLIELHRFSHRGLPTPVGPVWNLTGIWDGILEGLTKATKFCAAEKLPLRSIGVDTWGVDWGLLGQGGEILSLPHCYRDPQNLEIYSEAVERLDGEAEIYDRTGIQLMEINTVFQLYARLRREPELLSAAHRLVFTPDLFHYWLCGKVTNERSIASTSSLINLRTNDWDQEIIEKLGIPNKIFGEMSEPGTILGRVLPEVVEETGCSTDLQVILPASHDTASAVASVPASGDSWLYLSSGTWSLIGAELKTPNNSAKSFESGFTNEVGFNKTIRYLKNITGLWLLQELRRDHQKATGEALSFDEIVQLATESNTTAAIDPDEPEFSQPREMKQKILACLSKTGQQLPTSFGDYARCCFNGLADCYQRTIGKLEENLSRTFDDLIVVGGGSRNQLLNRLIAERTGKNVVVGSTEASATGNVLIQAWALDHTLDIRKVECHSWESKDYFG